MSARETERELIVALHRHAEDAMNRTDTQEELLRFQADIERRSGRSRRWAVGAAAAAGVAAVAGFALWSADLGDRADSGPAGNSQTTEEEVAQGFVEAFAAGDEDRVASYLPPGGQLGEMDDWRATIRRDEAWSREYFLGQCVETGTSPDVTTVYCPFDMHVLHSEQLGLGLDTGNRFTVRVGDGRVLSMEGHTTSGNNIEDEVFSAIGEWVEQNHPGKWEFMSSPAAHTPAEMQRWYRMWERYSQEYADAVTQEGGDSAG
jgi:hypothetical protein